MRFGKICSGNFLKFAGFMEKLCNIVRSNDIKDLVGMIGDGQKVWMICDSSIWSSFAGSIAAELGDRLLGKTLLEATEERKTFETVQEIISGMLMAGADRNVFVLGIGGGITTDLSGFVASIYKRGVRFAFVPTTLLAQVDAAIGGKNGVNFLSYKNMVGVIRQPEFTYISSIPLKTLPEKEFLEGLAELLKTFLIADAQAYREILSLIADARATGLGLKDISEKIEPFAALAAQIKADIVSRDPDEHGIRKVLNLGHTFAHAIEKLSAGAWSHGNAVAVGIVLAAELSGRVTETEKGLAENIRKDFISAGLPVECPYSLPEMADAMSKDKKAGGGKVAFVLLKKPGEVEIVPMDVAKVCE